MMIPSCHSGIFICLYHLYQVLKGKKGDAVGVGVLCNVRHDRVRC